MHEREGKRERERERDRERGRERERLGFVKHHSQIWPCWGFRKSCQAAMVLT